MEVIKKSLLLSSFLITSCLNANKKYYPAKQCGNQDSVYTEYQKCDLSNIKDYYDVIIDNSKKSNKVVLYLAGGPDVSSPYEEFKKDIDYDYGLKVLEINGVSHFLMNQSQYLKQKKFLDGNLEKFTYEDGYKEHLETVDNVQRVIKYLKEQGKKVGLAGSSYGSFVVNEYLAKYGDDTPDFVLSLAGRLKIGNADKLKSAFKIAFSKYHANIFIGKNDSIDDSANKLKHEKPKNVNVYEVAYKIGMDGLTKDYTKEIKDKNLNKTTFLTAEPDKQVGWFNQEEITWAKSRNAKIKVYSRAETIKYYEQAHPNYKLTKEEFEEALKDFAHGVGTWDYPQVREYYLNAFGD